MKTKQWPICDICKTGIQKISTYKDSILMRNYYSMECHNETQTVFTHRNEDIEILRAFVEGGRGVLISEHK